MCRTNKSVLEYVHIVNFDSALFLWPGSLSQGAAQAHGGCGVNTTAQQFKSLAITKMRFINDVELYKGASARRRDEEHVRRRNQQGGAGQISTWEDHGQTVKCLHRRATSHQNPLHRPSSSSPSICFS